MPALSLGTPDGVTFFFAGGGDLQGSGNCGERALIEPSRGLGVLMGEREDERWWLGSESRGWRESSSARWRHRAIARGCQPVMVREGVEVVQGETEAEGSPLPFIGRRESGSMAPPCVALTANWPAPAYGVA